MRKRSIVVCISLLVVLAILFSGCKVISSLFGKLTGGGATTLATPANLNLEEGVLTWSAVENADRYDIEVTQDGESRVFTSKMSSYDFAGEVLGNVSIRIKAKPKEGSKEFNNSAFSQALQATIYFTLTIEESSLRATVNGETLTLTFGAVDHADAYEITYTKGAEAAQTRQVTTPSFSIDSYDKTMNYRFSVKALGSGWYKTSAPVEYAEYAVQDYTDAPLLELDLADGEGAIFPVANVLRITINEEAVAQTAYASNTSTTLTHAYLNDLPLGKYRVALYNQVSVVCYYLDIADTRAPKVTISTYLKHSENISGSIEPYHNTLVKVSKGETDLTQEQALIQGGSITFSAAYLDGLSKGAQTFTLHYLQGEAAKTTDFVVNISVQRAELLRNAYTFTGTGDLVLEIATHGDVITQITGESGTLAAADYQTAKNTLVIYQTYLSSHNGANFTIHTAEGAAIAFTVEYRLNGFVPAEEVYDFDKNAGVDLVVTGTLHGETAMVYGNKITAESYLINGSKYVVLDKDYLNELKAGSYRFMVESDGYYSYFSVRVFNTNAKPYNVKFNFDIDENAYVTFDCDCGASAHTCSLDGASAVAVASPQKVNGFTYSSNHSLTVNCTTCSTSTSASYTGVSGDALTCMTKRLKACGQNQNAYVESLEELAYVIQYSAYGADGNVVTDEDARFGKTTVSFYVSDDFLNYIRSDSNYFKKAMELSAADGISCSLSYKGHNYTLTTTFTASPNADAKSGMQKAELGDTRTLLVESDRANNFNDFPINAFDKEESILYETELEELPYGVRPTFAGESQAKNVYDAALAACRTYISDSMSDAEKVQAIYHWLVSNVTYDNYTLLLYDVSRMSKENITADAFQSWLSSYLSSHPEIASIVEPLTHYDDMEMIRSFMRVKMKALRSFKLSGALLDNVAVCDGIASAFKLMCLIEGIPCIKVSGLGITGNAEPHAWNKVYIDGHWYVVDATWGRNGNTNAHHVFFLISEEQAIATHLEGAKAFGDVSVVDVLADESYGYYTSDLVRFQVGLNEYDLNAESALDLRNTVDALRLKGQKLIEIHLDFDYDSENLGDLLRTAGIYGSYIPLSDDTIILLFE